MQFNNTTLVVEQKLYAAKTENAYILYDLDNWPKITIRNVASKIFFFGVTNIPKNSVKSEVYIVAMEYHLMGKVSSILVKALLGIL